MCTLPRPVFSSVSEYGQYFTQLYFWRPYIEHICALEHIPYSAINNSIPGTNVVFRIDERYIIKIFPELFDGAAAFSAEKAIYMLLASHTEIAKPALLASGQLFDSSGGWHWPYLITTMIPGQAVSQTMLSQPDRLFLADWVAKQLHALHAVRPRAALGPRLQPGWQEFERFLEEQRCAAVRNHREWASLPEHLIEQLEHYLLPEHGSYARPIEPIVMHADLHADHVLGSQQPQGWWRPNGLIDFDDARVGELAYELPPIYLSLFARDKVLLQQFFDSYGLSFEEQKALRQRAMHMTLLHEFNVLDGILAQEPALMQVPTLQDLERVLWGSDL